MESFKHLSVEEARPMMALDTTVVIDIRDMESFRKGHISGSIHLDNTSLPEFIQSAAYENPIIVCCYHGNMSQAAADFLIQQGFDEVYSLDGGYAQWSGTYPDDTSTNL